MTLTRCAEASYSSSSCCALPLLFFDDEVGDSGDEEPESEAAVGEEGELKPEDDDLASSWCV